MCLYENVYTDTPSDLHKEMEKSCPCYCAGAHVGLDTIFRKQVQAFKTQLRGGAGISKVVRPLEMKDYSCMCTGWWGWMRGGRGRSTTGNTGGSRD